MRAFKLANYLLKMLSLGFRQSWFIVVAIVILTNLWYYFVLYLPNSIIFLCIKTNTSFWNKSHLSRFMSILWICRFCYLFCFKRMKLMYSYFLVFVQSKASQHSSPRGSIWPSDAFHTISLNKAVMSESTENPPRY